MDTRLFSRLLLYTYRAFAVLMLLAASGCHNLDEQPITQATLCGNTVRSWYISSAVYLEGGAATFNHDEIYTFRLDKSVTFKSDQRNTYYWEITDSGNQLLIWNLDNKPAWNIQLRNVSDQTMQWQFYDDFTQKNMLMTLNSIN